MERPSHLSSHASHSFARRLASLGLAVLFPLSVLWALTHAMAGHSGGMIQPLHFIPDRETVIPATPPPLPKLEQPDQIKAIDPVIKYDPDQKDERTITTTMPPQNTTLQQPPSTGMDRAPVGVTATHTRPPYPLLAQRLGVEGKVTLRLTVLADGRVGQADIVTSSGRGDLDETARDWILAHWAYRPALENGQPAVSQTLATVVFSLQNAR